MYGKLKLYPEMLNILSLRETGDKIEVLSTCGTDVEVLGWFEQEKYASQILFKTHNVNLKVVKETVISETKEEKENNNDK